MLIPAGEFLMGGDDAEGFPDDGEGPVRSVRLSAYRIDSTAVSNAQFATFVKATGHQTVAERFGWSFVFFQHVADDDRDAVLDAHVPGAPWWRAVRGADWRHPFGPSMSAGQLSNHPVVHVGWTDAVAYARWAGKQLPTEAQWERAARGGLSRARYPWGDEFRPRGQRRCNTWEGTFPSSPVGGSGRVATAPVTAYRPNGFGIYNASGNVWEWCKDRWSVDWHRADQPATRLDPQGPPQGETRVMRGGSFLCHDSYCNRYRVAARTHGAPENTSGHLGFRCVQAENGEEH